MDTKELINMWSVFLEGVDENKKERLANAYNKAYEYLMANKDKINIENFDIMIFAIIRRILCGTNVLLELNIPTIINLFPQCKNEAELKYKKDETVDVEAYTCELISEKYISTYTNGFKKDKFKI